MGIQWSYIQELINYWGHYTKGHGQGYSKGVMMYLMNVLAYNQ